MKKLSFALTAMLLSINAFAGLNLGNIGAAMRGQQEYQQKQQLDQCMATCRPGDGYCYQGCASAYTPKQEQPRMNQIPMTQQPRIDWSCVNNYPQQDAAYGLKIKNCSY